MKLDFSKLDRAFKPKTLAVIGDRPDGLWFRMLGDFKGKLYSVHVNPETIKEIEAAGIPNYKSLADIPGPIDLVIVSTPRAAALSVLEDCIKSDVGGAHFFTAGFSETDSEEWTEVEKKIAKKAKEAGLHLVGPNCMGIYSPAYSVGQNLWEYKGSTDPVAMISQSGTNCTTFCQLASLQGLDVTRAVSFGNGVVLDSPDYLEYFLQDDEIKVIAMYLEGVKDGRRFIDVLKKVTPVKPVVIWKGGRTSEGVRAINSHTGSLAISQAIWDTALKQCGAVQVDNVEELIDTVKALLYLKPVYSNKVAIAGGSGGQSVAIADAFGAEGFELPPLSKESYDELGTFFSVIGAGYPNPIDTGGANRQQIKHIMEILEKDPNVENLVLQSGARFLLFTATNQDYDILADIKGRSDKPVMAVYPFSNPDDMKRVMEDTREFQKRGIPSFPSFERGARALRNTYEYYQMQRK
ncbi:CoA-binding protein [Chloroflexota bacterium]